MEFTLSGKRTAGYVSETDGPDLHGPFDKMSGWLNSGDGSVFVLRSSSFSFFPV